MSGGKVAVLGLGMMGAGMARNLVAAGMPTTVWNRNPERSAPLADAGATVAASVAEAVAGADVVLTMLWDADSVIDTLRLGEGSYAADAVLVQASTVGIEGSERIGQVANELGLVYIDSPVLGTKQPAESGDLVVLASGPRVTEPIVAPIFNAVGAKTVWLGEAGEASRLKMVINALVLSLTASVAQSIGLARALGIDPQAFLDAIDGGALDSPYLRAKSAAMMAGEFPASFALDGGAKDAALILEAGAETSADLTLMRAVHQQLLEVLAAGHGDEDLAAVVRVHN